MALPEIKLKHNRLVTIATGTSRKSTKWVNSEMLWSELVARLSVPLRTQETMSEYQHMPKAKRDVIKDVGGFVGGMLSGGRRQADNIKSRSIITLDLDLIPTGVDIWTIVELLDFSAAMYSTHSSTEASNRVRVVIPLSRDVSPDEYGAVSRKIAQDIGIDFCDDTTYEPHRLMYWASCSVDADYLFNYADAPLLDPDTVLDRYHDWRDVAEWPQSSRKAAAISKQGKKQGDPAEKPGIIGAFCKTYDIPAAIDKFLPETYEAAPDGNRYTYVNGSTTGGLVLYDDGQFAYSHHGTDPISGMLVNSFDLVRVHRFRDLDEDAGDVAVNKLPSYKAMTDLALADEAAAYQLTLDRVSAFDDEPEEDTEWLKLLELTGKGGIANTIDNVVVILTHDPRFADRFYFDEFKEKPIVSGDLPWIAFDRRLSAVWSDTDDAGLRRFLEHEYKIESASKIRDAVELAMLSRTRHPVREYLSSLTWDGELRCEELFIKYLGAEDNEYTRAVTKASLIGAVARIMKPGCKHDHMLVLVGPQGCRKSTTLAKLGKEWFSDSLYTLSGKDAYEQIQGYWIIEMGEMAAARKSEVEQIKQFMSKQSDSYRAAYARRTQEHLRQCAFFGSTNDSDFLKDPTGARRFWPVVVDKTGNHMADKLTDALVDQIWAEALCCYQQGDKWYLADKVEAMAREVQAEHTEISDKTGLVQAFVDTEVPLNWDAMTLEERKTYWAEDFDGADKPETTLRTKVCAIEVWCELFNGDAKAYTRQQGRELNDILKTLPGWEQKQSVNFGAGYGRQRGFVRKSTSLLD